MRNHSSEHVPHLAHQFMVHVRFAYHFVLIFKPKSHNIHHVSLSRHINHLYFWMQGHEALGELGAGHFWHHDIRY